MNAMSKALADAGVPLPTSKERIWRVIKEAPGISSKQLHARLRDMPVGTISSQVQLMRDRGMIFAKKLEGARRGPRGAIGFQTDLESYQLLPPLKSAQAAKPAVVEARPADASQDLDKLIDNLTIKQARQLYTKLRGLFQD